MEKQFKEEEKKQKLSVDFNQKKSLQSKNETKEENQKKSNQKEIDDKKNSVFLDPKVAEQLKKGEKVKLKQLAYIRLQDDDFNYVDIKQAIDIKDQNNIKILRDFLIKKILQNNFYNSYKLVSQLGKGAFAIVYLAYHRETKKKYAVKVFNKQKLGQNRTGFVSLENEIEIMRQCDHKNILKLYEVYESDNNIYLVMELHVGGSLHERIVKKQSFTMKEVQQIMKQLLESLNYLHSQRIMHRDLKPDNILFENDDELNCIIADLGLAQKVDAQIFLYTKCGTFGYVAPEIWKTTDKYSKYTEQCDIYSLGIIFNIITTGKSPFQDKNSEKTKEKNKLGYINFGEPFYQKLSNECLELLKRMLDKNPETRITARNALKHEFFTKPNQIPIIDQLKATKDTKIKTKELDPSIRETQPTGTPSNKNKNDNQTNNTTAAQNNQSPLMIPIAQIQDHLVEDVKQQFPVSPFMTPSNHQNKDLRSQVLKSSSQKKIEINYNTPTADMNRDKRMQNLMIQVSNTPKAKKYEDDSFRYGYTPIMKGRINDIQGKGPKKSIGNSSSGGNSMKSIDASNANFDQTSKNQQCSRQSKFSKMYQQQGFGDFLQDNSPVKKIQKSSEKGFNKDNKLQKKETKSMNFNQKQNNQDQQNQQQLDPIQESGIQIQIQE